MKKRILLLGLAVAMPLFSSQASAAVRHLHLAATDGMMYLPNHNGYAPNTPATGGVYQAAGDYRKVYIRGFCDDVDGTAAQPGCANMPAPIIDVNQGDDVFVHLRNIGNANPLAPVDPHTIHLHGLHVSTQNDGFNETSWEVPTCNDPVLNADPVAQQACLDAGNDVGTYYFKAQKPGTYMWHCHVEASEHITMGMYGAMVIRPRGKKNQGKRVYGFDKDRYDREFIVLLSDIDTAGHDAIQTDFDGAAFAGLPYGPKTPAEIAEVESYNFADHQADWWMVNGRAFPDVLLPLKDMAACNAASRTADPATGDFEGCNGRAEGPPTGMLTGSNNDPAIPFRGKRSNYAATIEANWNERVLMRIINMGYQEVPWHIHGAHFSIVGKDANPFNSDDQKREMYTVHVGSGETYDVILPTSSLARVGMNATQSFTNGQGGGANEFGFDWGAIDPNNVDQNLLDQWYPAHSHNDYTVTNNGLYPGGQAQLIHISNTIQ